MKNVLKKMKNKILIIGIAIVSIGSEVRAEVLESIYDVSPMHTYAPERPPQVSSILGEILKLIIIPLVVLIGLTTYYKKGKNNRYKKITKILIGITSILIVAWVIYSINRYV